MISRLLPANWNDVLAIILLIGLPVFWGWLLKQGIPQEVMLLLLGALLGHFGQIVTYYFRKSPPAEPPSVPRG